MLRSARRIAGAIAIAGSIAVTPASASADVIPATNQGAVSPAIVNENSRPGTTEWKIPDIRALGRIEGYADRVSYQRTELVTLFVSTTARTYTYSVFRLGFYGGLGGRLMQRSGVLPGYVQTRPVVEPVTRKVEARWRPAAAFRIGGDWLGGDYLVKLQGDNGGQFQIPFTLRDDSSEAPLAVLNSVNTWQAYNAWGGYSMYGGPKGFADRSRVVSFDRPYPDFGASEFMTYEYPFVAFAESLGLAVTYLTDVDVHNRPDLLLRHKALIVPGHDEYWSPAMRAAAEQARDSGVNLAFLGANSAYRNIRFLPSALGANRTMVSYKAAAEDPLMGKENAAVTVAWREPPLNRPETALLGAAYDGCDPAHADMVISDPASWVFAGTDLRPGDHIPGLVGYEYDRVLPGMPTPAGLQVLAHSPVRCGGRNTFADMTYYTTAQGAGVLDASTLEWTRALGGGRPDARIRKATQNICEAFAAGPAGVMHPALPNAATVLALAGDPTPSVAPPGGYAPAGPTGGGLATRGAGHRDASALAVALLFAVTVAAVRARSGDTRAG